MTLSSYKEIWCLSFFVIFFITIPYTQGNFNNPEVFTQNEIEKIQELYERIKYDVNSEIMAENRTLVRFLRARIHNVDNAESMIRKTLSWRNEWEIDTILNEDWNRWIKNTTLQVHIHDKNLRPAVVANVGAVNVRKLVLSGKQRTLDRFVVYTYERLMHLTKSSEEKTKIPFVAGYLLFNMAGYTARTHACLACIQSWLRVTQHYEYHYPQLGFRISVINTPAIFKQILDILKPFYTPHTLKIMKFYGLDKSEWKEHLLENFAEDLLTPEYGGKGPIIYADSLHNPMNVTVIN